MFFMASSAAAEPIMRDEGIPSDFLGMSDMGRVSLGTFFARTKKVPRHQGEKETIRLRN